MGDMLPGSAIYLASLDAIYLLCKCDIRFTMFACDMICIPFHVPQAHIALFAYRIPQGYIAHSGRNAYRCRAFGRGIIFPLDRSRII